MPLQVTPKNISLHARETQVFQAAGATGAVTWSIQPHNGRIDQNGVYVAPFAIARNTNVTVQAHDGTQFDAANIALDAGWFWIHLLGVYWVVWAAILLVLGLRHPKVMIPSEPLDNGRRFLAFAAALIFALTFIPTPFSIH